jgi:hypothetical protein
LSAENRVRDFDEVTGGLESKGESEICAEHVGGIGERSDFFLLQCAGRDNFKSAVFAELPELGGDAFGETFAEGSELEVGEFGVGSAGREGKDGEDFGVGQA